MRRCLTFSYGSRDILTLIMSFFLLFRSVSRSLGVTKERPFFTFMGRKIYIMYDPPHLLKNLRNNWRKHGFLLHGSDVKWKFLEVLYEEDQKVELQWRLVPKLTTKHINIPPFGAMNVRRAAQVLSHSVAAGLNTLMRFKILGNEAAATAEFVEKIDNLFNCFNAENLNDPHKFRKPLNSSSDHVQFLRETKLWFQGLKPASCEALPCLEGWMQSIEALLLLWEDLKHDFDLNFLMTRRLNQDGLENFFSVIRGKGGHRFNPNATQFRAAYRAATVDKLFALSKKSNCIDDMEDVILKVCELQIRPQENLEKLSPNMDAAVTFDPQDLAVPCTATIAPCTETAALVYVCGYLVRRAGDSISCDQCLILQLQSKEAVSENLDFALVMNKQYSSLLPSEGLLVPSDEIVRFAHHMDSRFRGFIQTIFHHGRLLNRLQTCVLKNSDHVVGCPVHEAAQKHFLSKLFCKVKLHQFLREQTSHFSKKGRRNRKAVKFLHL